MPNVLIADLGALSLNPHMPTAATRSLQTRLTALAECFQMASSGTLGDKPNRDLE